jgi:hypothetical protein
MVENESLSGLAADAQEANLAEFQVEWICQVCRIEHLSARP